MEWRQLLQHMYSMLFCVFLIVCCFSASQRSARHVRRSICAAGSIFWSKQAACCGHGKLWHVRACSWHVMLSNGEFLLTLQRTACCAACLCSVHGWLAVLGCAQGGAPQHNCHQRAFLYAGIPKWSQHGIAGQGMPGQEVNRTGMNTKNAGHEKLISNNF